MDEEGAKYQQVARLQYEEIERLRAQIREKDAELDVLVAWIASDAGAHAALCSIYADPRQSASLKTKAASAAIGYEIAKPAATNIIIDFKARVRDARLTTVELRKQEWTRQPPLDLSGPTPPTILGGDHEGEAPGPEPAA
jgi:hypothetical protein